MTQRDALIFAITGLDQASAGAFAALVVFGKAGLPAFAVLKSDVLKAS